MHSWFAHRMDYVLFCYGFSFLVLGMVAAKLRRGPGSLLAWKWLALFGVVHGCNEFLDLARLSGAADSFFDACRCGLLVSSFLFLAEFGRASLAGIDKRTPGRWIFIPALGLAALGAVQGFRGLEIGSRYVLALPGGFAAACALVRVAVSSAKPNRALLWAGVAIALYAIAAGVVVPSGPFFPSTLINYDWFARQFGFPVQFLRAGLALAIAAGIWAHFDEINAKHSGMTNLLKSWQRWCLFLTLICLLVAGGIAADWASSRAITKMRLDLLAKARLSARAINPDRLSRLTKVGPGAAPLDFETLKQQLGWMLQSMPECRGIQLLGLQNTKLISFLDACPGAEQGITVWRLSATSPLDSRYVAARREFVLQEPHSGGAFQSVLGVVAICDPVTTQLFGALQVEISASQWLETENLYRLLPIGLTFFLGLLIIGADHLVRLGRYNNLLLATTKDGIIGLDTRCWHTFANKAATEMLGYQPHELLGRPCHELWHRARPDVTPSPVQECLICAAVRDGSLRQDCQSVLWRKDGSSFPVEYTSTPTCDNGMISGAVIRFRDITERKKAEDALREREERYRMLFENNPQPMWVFDTETFFFLAVNSAAVQRYGYSRDEFLKMSIKDVRPPEDIPALENDVVHSRFGYRRAGIWRHRKKDGGIIDVEIYSDVVDYGGRSATLVMPYDITERKRAQESLQRYQLLAKYSRDIILFVRRSDGRIIEANDAAINTYGYTQNELLALTIMDLRSPASMDLAEDQMHAADTSGILFQTEHRRKNGTTFRVEVSASGMELGGERVLLSIIRDISDRTRTEEKVREQAALIDAAQDAIAVWDLNGCNVFWNHGAARLYGWTAEEIKGRAGELLIAGEAAPISSAILAKTLETGSFGGELRTRTKAGRELVVMNRCTLIRDHQGQPKVILSIDTDLTEQKKIETQLLRSQRMETLGALASGVAHDLNNILAPIPICASLLRAQLTDEASCELLEMMRNSAHRGGDIIKQLLIFARGVDGERFILNPRHLLKEVHRILTETFPRNIEIRVEAPKDTWPISSSPTHVHQVLMNLSVNGRDAMPGGGVLTLAVENIHVDEEFVRANPDAKPGPHIVFIVRDTGIGIPERILDRIFDPFFTTKQVGHGTGLGLPTVLGIAKSHGGFVTVSSHVNQGSEFRVFLPALPNHLLSGSPTPQEVIPRANGEQILVVDDELPIRESLKRMLELHGYRVILAKNGLDALDIYSGSAKELNAIITDIAMPQMNGLALVQALKTADPNVKVIIGTGLEPDTSELNKLAPLEILKKPYTTEAVLKCLHKLLNGLRAL